MSLHVARCLIRGVSFKLAHHARAKSVERSPSLQRRHKSKDTRDAVSASPVLLRTIGQAQEEVSEAEEHVPAPEPSYVAGETYYSFNPQSFNELESELSSDRQPQPKSGNRMTIQCLEKLSEPDKPQPRRLLPEEYGYLVEWPGKLQPKTKYNPVYSVMEKKYGLKESPHYGSLYSARIPL